MKTAEEWWCILNGRKPEKDEWIEADLQRIRILQDEAYNQAIEDARAMVLSLTEAGERAPASYFITPLDKLKKPA